MSKARLKVAAPCARVQGFQHPAAAGTPFFQEGAPMDGYDKPGHRSQITGNAGLNYTAWQLSRRGWHVMPTIRNAKGSDLVVTDADETTYFGVQSKALGKRSAVPLGMSLEALRSDWWAITVHANSDAPICYLLRLEEVRHLATQDRNGGRWWLEPKSYDRAEFREAWHRLESAGRIAD